MKDIEKAVEGLNAGMIDRPKHYTFGKFEVIEVIEDWNLGFRLGNAVKYIARAGRKFKDKQIEDLEKARWYLDREIQKLKEINNVQENCIKKFDIPIPCFHITADDMSKQLSKIKGPRQGIYCSFDGATKPKRIRRK